MFDLYILYVHIVFFESAKIVMICSLNLDLSSFFELFPFYSLTILLFLNKRRIHGIKSTAKVSSI
jgi:hypothetical protein